MRRQRDQLSGSVRTERDSLIALAVAITVGLIVTVILLAGCSAGSPEASSATDPSPSTSNSAPLIGDASASAIPAPSQAPTTDGVPAVPTSSVQLSWSSTDGQGGDEDTTPVGVFTPGDTVYVPVSIPAQATLKSVAFHATPVAGQPALQPPTVRVAALPDGASCTGALFTKARPKSLVVTVTPVTDPTAAVTASPDPSQPSPASGEHDVATRIGQATPATERVCAEITVPDTPVFSGVVSGLTLSWAKPGDVFAEDYWMTTVYLIGTPTGT